MDNVIVYDEARLGDIKRATIKDTMELRLGGLLEFAEKATVCIPSLFSSLDANRVLDIDRWRTRKNSSRSML